MFRTVVTQVQHLQAYDLSRLSHVSGYAPARFDLERLADPSCSPKPLTLAQAQTILVHFHHLHCPGDPGKVLHIPPYFWGLFGTAFWCIQAPLLPFYAIHMTIAGQKIVKALKP